jgi:excisionase family DNA binding protein
MAKGGRAGLPPEVREALRKALEEHKSKPGKPGRGYRTIAKKLGLSVQTVIRHAERLEQGVPVPGEGAAPSPLPPHPAIRLTHRVQKTREDVEARLAVAAPLLTLMEAAKFLSLGKTKTYELVNARRLHSVRIGSALRIPREAVQKFIEDNLIIMDAEPPQAAVLKRPSQPNSTKRKPPFVITVEDGQRGHIADFVADQVTRLSGKDPLELVQRLEGLIAVLRGTSWQADVSGVIIFATRATLGAS